MRTKRNACDESGRFEQNLNRQTAALTAIQADATTEGERQERQERERRERKRERGGRERRQAEMCVGRIMRIKLQAILR